MEKKRFLLVKIICSLSTSEVQIFPVKARSNGRFQRHREKGINAFLLRRFLTFFIIRDNRTTFSFGGGVRYLISMKNNLCLNLN